MGRGLARLFLIQNRLVSIQVVFPASGKERLETVMQIAALQSFHSSSFPSEWEVFYTVSNLKRSPEVSIQVVFPASGKSMNFISGLAVQSYQKFPFK